MFMKKILFIVSVLLAGGLAGCSENEIELYNQEVCLNFANPGWSTEFSDADYVNGVTTKEAPVTVELQGNLLTAPRTFCLKNQEAEGYKETVTADFANPYTYENLEGVTQKLTVQVHRPKRPTDGIGNRACACQVVFDYANAQHQFPEGRVDKAMVNIVVSFKIKPTEWDDAGSMYGAFSINKYLFMMDTLKKTYADVAYDDASLEQVKKVYEEYLKTNPPLLDDKGQEITFP